LFKGEERGLREFRKHLNWYFKGMKNSKMLKERVNTLSKFDEFLEIIKIFGRIEKCKT